MASVRSHIHYRSDETYVCDDGTGFRAETMNASYAYGAGVSAPYGPYGDDSCDVFDDDDPIGGHNHYRHHYLLLHYHHFG